MSTLSTVGSIGSDEIVVIEPIESASHSFTSNIKELWSYRDILALLTTRLLKVRYKNSVLGLAWSLFPPITQSFALTFVVGYILGAGPSNLSAYMLCAFLPWTLFLNSVLDGASSVNAFGDLLKKLYLPRELFPISTILANVVHFGAALVVF